jgi:hypothetical protein
MSKLMMRNAENTILAMLEEKKEDAKEWLASEQGAKFVYSVGALLAQGFKGGMGIQKQGGKFSFEGLLMNIAGQFLGKKFGVGGEQQQPQETAVAERIGLG